MLKSQPLFSLAIAAALFAGCAVSDAPQSNEAPKRHLTALDRYVAKPDPSFAWKLAESATVPGGQVSVIDLTSQTWLTTNEVNRTQWKHWVVVAKPDDLKHSTALLFISGGNNKDNKVPKPSKELLMIANATKSVVVELRMVPNQPLIFGNDGKERVEDDLIAYTWDKFLRTGDERWPARLPMTKSAVRAMDVVTAFCASDAGGKSKVDSFVVAGGSKRGWTTWTTAAVDPRVVAICPIVIDVLNLEPSMIHHYQAYGFFAPAVGDYTSHGIMDWMGTPEMKALMAIEEPYSYRERFTMPKLLMNACGDQFFLPDSSQFYLKDLPGKTFLRYVPNTDHGLKGSDGYETLAAWHHATLNHAPLPEFTWKHASDGSVSVSLKSGKPGKVKLWQATNPNARDFRLETLGAKWSSTEITAQPDGTYRGAVTSPEKGWTAYMMELTFDLGGPVPLKLTTDVRVIPDTTPHAAPSATRPKGYLSR
jgi:PhoPQ-activated pathogenicity-related protein